MVGMNDQQFSLLSGEEIESKGLVDESVDKFFRASTYDLSVGEIILDGAVVCEGNTFALPPGGMVRVVSKESLHLPETITGHVLLKNDLCAKGVLAINIGVVDPGFRGPISSTLINFGRAGFPVEKGTPFLRVSFHRCPQSPRAKHSVQYDRADYLKRVKQEVLAYSGPTFLNMDATAAKAAASAFDSFKNALFGWATVVGLLVAFLAIFAPLGASIVDKHLERSDKRQTELEEKIEKKVEERYESRLKELSDKVEHLTAMAPTSAGKARNGNGSAPGKP
jgi:deoxycytidine triphosphate deaminase